MGFFEKYYSCVRHPSPEARAFTQKRDARHNALDQARRSFLDGKSDNPIWERLRSELDRDDAASFRAWFAGAFDWLYEAAVFERFRPVLAWTMEHITEWPYTSGLTRRALRSKHIVCYCSAIQNIVGQFHERCSIDAELCDVLTFSLPPEAAAWAREYQAGISPEWVAYEIDRGNGRLIALLKAMLNDEPGAVAPSQTLFKGILRAHNAELYEALGRLLLAARLQEGLRQAICEAADEGTIEGFLTLLRVIRDNNLIRFSAVKRAVGCWLGFTAEDSAALERIGAKQVELLWRAFEGEDRRREMLSGEDSMEIFIALASGAFIEAENADGALRIAKEGSRHQALVCAYFALSMGMSYYLHHMTKSLLLARPDDAELPAILSAAYGQHLYWASRQSGGPALRDRYFADEEERARFTRVFKNHLELLGNKRRTFSPCVFPWYSAKLEPDALALILVSLAILFGSDEEKDEALPLLKRVDPWSRDECLKALLSDPKRPAQFRALFEALGDKSGRARDAAYKIAKELAPDKLDYAAIEELLRLKGDVRAKAVSLLLKQDDAALIGCIKRLLADRSAAKQCAAYELILQAAKAGRDAALLNDMRALVQTEPASEDVKPLYLNAREALGINEGAGQMPLFTDGDVYELDLSPIAEGREYREAFLRLFPDSQVAENLSPGGISPSCAKAYDDLNKLIALIDAHRGEAFVGDNGGKGLLGYAELPLAWPYIHFSTDREYPFRALWEKWFEDIGGFAPLMRAFVLLHIRTSPLDRAVEALLGAGFTRYIRLSYSLDLFQICEYLLHIHSDGALAGRAALYLGYLLSSQVKDEDFVAYRDNGEPQCLLRQSQISLLSEYLKRPEGGPEPLRFAARAALQGRYGRQFAPAYRQYMEKARNERLPYSWFGPLPDCAVTVYDCLRACDGGWMSRSALVRRLLEPENIKKSFNGLSLIALKARAGQGEVMQRGRFLGNKLADANRAVNSLLCGADADSEEGRRLIALALEIGETLLSRALESELKRGETPAEYSSAVRGIECLIGAERLMKLLRALGSEPFRRNESYADLYNDSALPRRDSLSSLIAVCVPGPEDDAQSFQRLVKQYGVSDTRLIELAMFNPAWVEFAEATLGLEGFTSAVYYFIAHMNERLEEQHMAIIARYTPLTREQLAAGAFDAAWFKSAYEALGETMFDRLYEAAKYISTGAQHSRARRYADAALGRLDVAQTEAQIAEKRNKDLLMAYAIIPVSDESDLLRRYEFIQRFLRESKKFGAQRSASEKLACGAALQNLANNSGDSDVTRMTLRLENRLSEDKQALFEPRALGDATVYLECADDGAIGLVCEKQGKRLKSVPSALKKDETVAELNEARKALTDQQRRTRAFMEQAMEDATGFSAGEIRLLGSNPILKHIINRLVFRAGERFAMLENGNFADVKGEKLFFGDDEPLTVAHPYQLYRAGVWTAWQRLLFEKRVVQPFKQVFRELYVLTRDEEGKTESLRYAGHQVQPQKTAAVLKARRWLADPESGLQKVFYKDDLIATVYALADWFSPSDIEAPTLEYVAFYRRGTGRAVKLDEVPPVVFSEVMRDVDLAVSVAHAGGVDPETSHSTIEMRQALVEFTLLLFRLTNVRVQGAHALIEGKRARYSLHLGSGVIHQQGGAMLNILPVHSQHRGRIFLPFADDDPQTAEILTKLLFLAGDEKIKDPFILEQIVPGNAGNK